MSLLVHSSLSSQLCRILLVAGMVWAGQLASISAAETEASAPNAALSVKPTGSDSTGWQVLIGDELFAGYQSDVNGTPIVFPLVAPGGKEATRGFPMRKALPTEKSDHDHHRSLWLNHGEVNGVDFWMDDKGSGRIVQTTGEATVDSARDAVVIRTANDWIGPDDKKILEDRRRFTFHVDGDRRIVDCDFLLTASDGPVHFGDTKEGSFGIRVAGTMKVDSKLGGKITNAEGLLDDAAWGKKSPWVDYMGPVEDQTVGITVHYHPSSFNAPCRWHVRSYGLFAANPFGEFHFTGGKKTEGHTLAPGESLTMSLRVVLRQGELDVEQANRDAEQYATETVPALK